MVVFVVNELTPENKIVMVGIYGLFQAAHMAAKAVLARPLRHKGWDHSNAEIVGWDLNGKRTGTVWGYDEDHPEGKYWTEAG
jgi:hypothetical protein